VLPLEKTGVVEQSTLSSVLSSMIIDYKEVSISTAVQKKFPCLRTCYEFDSSLRLRIMWRDPIGDVIFYTELI
jgi:hypothetical protein